nr:transposase [Catalinimonas alkaloidigena]
MSHRKNYTREFKDQAVQLAELNGVTQTSRDLDVHPSLIGKWKRQLTQNGEKAFPGKGNPRDEEVARLKRENARLQEEVQILKKAVGIFSTRPS